MNALPEHHRPKSDDPDFWGVWSGEGLKEDIIFGGLEERTVDWQKITDDWQRVSSFTNSAENSEPEVDPNGP
ncbi:hypothetical protein [Pseudomonas oryzihabitans]|uniref:hypothetical protein n=1 Tax=Pseudomonas oryzihabitans TaxID=47885 RepID=UPI0021B6AC14|nr:hypothetical protein [Pseudomonas oryzihabitans]